MLQPFETVSESILGRLLESGRKKTEMIDERKKRPNNTHQHPLQVQQALALLLLSHLLYQEDIGVQVSVRSSVRPSVNI